MQTTAVLVTSRAAFGDASIFDLSADSYKPSLRSYAFVAEDFIQFAQEANKYDIDPLAQKVLNAISYQFEFGLRVAVIDRANIHNLSMHDKWQERHVPALLDATKNGSDALFLLF